jgi:hypothetical protein
MDSFLGCYGHPYNNFFLLTFFFFKEWESLDHDLSLVTSFL